MISTQMVEQLDRGKTNTRRKMIFKLITLGALHPANHHPFPQATDPRMPAMRMCPQTNSRSPNVVLPFSTTALVL